VCRLFDFHEGEGPAGPIAFITMEFLDGETLADRLRSGPIPPRDALPLLEQMAEGLAAIHAKDVVHRDFKPGNVMLVQGRTGLRAVVTDFGIARPARTEIDTDWSGTAVGAVVGSPPYMAPEQRAGDSVTARTDIYALGLVAYEMLTGALPERGRMGRLPRGWSRPLRRALDPDPARRYADPRELVRDALRQNRRLVSAGIAALVLALPLVAALVAYRYRPTPPALPVDPRSIAVLPLTNLGGTTDDAYFSAGLTEDILIQLAKVPGLRVRSPVSAEGYQRGNKTLQQVAGELGVANILGGSVRRVGNRMRIAAELIDARSGQHRWAEMYDLESRDVLDVQRDVAAKVASALALKLTARDDGRLERGTTTNPAAYDHYLRGVSKAEEWAAAAKTAEGGADAGTNLDAIAEFQRALALDPRYGMAHAWLATVYTRHAMFIEGGGPSRQERWNELANEERRKALELEPGLSLSPPYAPPGVPSEQ
jgi:TolB-like protein